MTTDVGIVCFPGSNCEHDVARALGALGASTRILWHGDDRIGDVGAVVLPGGFAHGDYLRPGAIARFSPVMAAVADFAARGGPVVGICNGFQVLTEAGLLPGALEKQRGLRFICRTVECTVESTRSVLTARATAGTVLRLPINHFEGNYTCDAATLDAGRARRAGAAAVPGQPERRGARHRRDGESGGQRRRAHAAPRARLGPAGCRHGRRRPFPVAPRGGACLESVGRPSEPADAAN